MNVFIGSGDNHCFMAIMTFPSKWLSFRNVSGNAVGSIDTIGSHLFELEWKVSKYLTGQDVKSDRILPNSKLFKPSIDIFSFHDGFISWVVIFFNEVGKKPNIPSFHHSIIPWPRPYFTQTEF